MEKYVQPDERLEKLFRQAEPEIQTVAEKYGFSIRLIDNCKGALYFYPEVNNDHKFEEKDNGQG